MAVFGHDVKKSFLPSFLPTPPRAAVTLEQDMADLLTISGGFKAGSLKPALEHAVKMFVEKEKEAVKSKDD